MTDERQLDLTSSYGQITKTVDIGGGHAILFMADGLVRFAHDCDRSQRFAANHPARVENGGPLIRCAPRLKDVGQPGGHQIISVSPLHIEPSILCEDCGTHGWIRDGRWVNA